MRKITVGDAEAIRAVASKVFIDREIYSIEEYEMYCKNKYGYAIFIRDEMIAFALCMNNTITALAVDPAHHRKGYASQMLIKLIQDHGHLTLMVRSKNNSAFALYNKIGFRVVDVILNYYGTFTRVNDDAYIMDIK